MLKIKKDINLESLKKYGFEYQEAYRRARDSEGKIVLGPRIYTNGRTTKKKYPKWEQAIGEGRYNLTIEETINGDAIAKICIEEDTRVIKLDAYDISEYGGIMGIYDLDVLYQMIKDGIVEIA